MADEPTTNHYDTLGVDSDASQEQIKKAYKAKALEGYPDKNKDDPQATANFQALNEAYSVLKDADKRKAYDDKLAAETALTESKDAPTPEPEAPKSDKGDEKEEDSDDEEEVDKFKLGSEELEGKADYAKDVMGAVGMIAEERFSDEDFSNLKDLLSGSGGEEPKPQEEDDNAAKNDGMLSLEAPDDTQTDSLDSGQLMLLDKASEESGPSIGNTDEASDTLEQATSLASKL